jgi:hypothetical protein
METSRQTSPTILALAVILGGVFLLQQSGFFNGAFSTGILASIKAEDALTAADIAAGRSLTAENLDRDEMAAIR